MAHSCKLATIRQIFSKEIPTKNLRLENLEGEGFKTLKRSKCVERTC